jgi:hypothetical protein
MITLVSITKNNSKCKWNSICESYKIFPESLFSRKYKTVQSLELHFLQNNPLLQLYNFFNNCTSVRNIPGSHFVKAFSALPSHFLSCHQYHKSAIPSLLISVQGMGKNQLEPSKESMGDAPVLSHCSLLTDPWPKPTGVLEHCHEGETSCWFSISRVVYFWPRP